MKGQPVACFPLYVDGKNNPVLPGIVIRVGRQALVMWTEANRLNGALASTAPTMSSRGSRHSGIFYAVPQEVAETARKEHMFSYDEKGEWILAFSLPLSFYPSSEYQQEEFAEFNLADKEKDPTAAGKVFVYYIRYGKDFLVHVAVSELLT